MNIIIGIIILLVYLIAGYGIKVGIKRNKWKLSLVVILLLGLVLRVFVSTDLYLHDWDEKYHALVAKNMIEHPLKPMLYDEPVLEYDYKDWSGNHVWLHKQPIPLWSMAFSMYLFGTNEIALRLPSLLLSILAIFLTFKIASLLFGKKTGLIAAFLHSIHGLIIELTGGRVATDHVDLFFLFFIELGIYFALFHTLKKNDWKLLLLIGLATGLAILSKWLPALIVLPIWLLMNNFFKSKPVSKIFLDIIIVLITIVCVVLPWQLYIYSAFPLEAAWESQHHVKHVFEGLDGHGQPFYYHIDRFRILFGELIYIPLIWWFWKSFKKLQHKKEFSWAAISLWILVPLIFFSLVKTKMQAYLIFTAPAIFIITAVFWRYLHSVKQHFNKLKPLISIAAFLILCLPVRYSIERVKPFSSQDRNPQWRIDLKKMNEHFKDEKRVVVFNIDRPIEAMFYCDNIIAYKGKPQQEKLTKVFEKGYDAYLLKKNGEIQLLKKSK